MTTRWQSDRGGMVLCWLVLAWAFSVIWWTAPVQAQALDPSQLDPAQTGTAQLLGQAVEPTVPPFVPGEVLVGLQGEVSASAPWDGFEATQIETLDLRGMDGVTGYVLQVEPGSEWDAIEQLQQAPEVVFAEPNWLARIAQSADAPSALALPEAITLGDDTGTVETPVIVGDSLYPEQWYLQRIGMARSWQTAFSTPGGLRTIEVAVIDTGVDFSHPDLVDRLLPGRNYLVPGSAPADDNGHGTHISGLIGATANSRGMVGTGWRVTIVPLKVLGGAKGVGPVNDIAQAVVDAADAGVDIINLSLQIPFDSSPLRSAVNYAASQGVLLIAAAGNCSPYPCTIPVQYPAAYDNVMAIAASTYFDSHAWYSAVGNEIDLTAPGGGSGVSVLSTWSSLASSADYELNCPTGVRQVDGGLYCYADGTSMAAAVATGTAALVWSMRSDLSANDVRAILRETAVPINGTQDEVGAGRLDIAAAVRRAVRPSVEMSLDQVVRTVPYGTGPIEVPVGLDNPSLVPATWVITPVVANNWYGIQGDAAGIVRYGEPVEATLVLTPSVLGVTRHLGQYTVTTAGPDAVQVDVPIFVDLNIYSYTVASTAYAPLVSKQYQVGAWAQPGYTARTAYSISSSGRLAVSLPFTVTIGGRRYTDVTIGADGLVSLPATSFLPSLPVRCLANSTASNMLIYGWWSDLGTNAVGARISTFQPDADRFVIEYDKLVVVGSGDRVSFQIVLHRNGQVELNYADMPPDMSGINVVVGVSMQEGRFYNQIGCWTGSTKLGTLPRSHQSFVIKPEELF